LVGNPKGLENAFGGWREGSFSLDPTSLLYVFFGSIGEYGISRQSASDGLQ
jgi:hypothetical protein